VTCIVGLVHDTNIIMGGDAAGVSGTDLIQRKDGKVFINGSCIMGFTSSFRMGQLLRYRLKIPAQKEEQDLFDFMVNDFVDAVRDCLKTGGFAEKDKERESGGTFLVGYAGRLFEISSDFQVGESIDNFASCGCGSNYALGAMFATSGTANPRHRVEAALKAAEHFSAAVRSPFTIMSLANAGPVRSQIVRRKFKVRAGG
jgi:ATP-dependent protease HslVU (ClpYQ) peptidase subunit